MLCYAMLCYATLCYAMLQGALYGDVLPDAAGARCVEVEEDVACQRAFASLFRLADASPSAETNYCVYRNITLEQVLCAAVLLCCCVLCAVCCVLCAAVCCVLCAVCCVLCAVCCVLRAVCCVLCAAVCCVLCAAALLCGNSLFSLLFPLSSPLSPLFTLLSSLFSLLSLLSIAGRSDHSSLLQQLLVQCHPHHLCQRFSEQQQQQHVDLRDQGI